MAHFAKVVDGIVTNVIVAEEDFFDSFIDNSPGQWIQTSYNTRGGVHTNDETPLRKNFAGIGYIYDGNRDAFYTPQPYNSWVLNETSCLWEAPIAVPNDADTVNYVWDEDAYQADNTTGWVIVE